jgi:signal transduction histidine kinase
MAMGLGLPPARCIVERHGGTLTVQSTGGKGIETVDASDGRRLELRFMVEGGETLP